MCVCVGIASIGYSFLSVQLKTLLLFIVCQFAMEGENTVLCVLF